MIWLKVIFTGKALNDIFLNAKQVFPQRLPKSLGHWFSPSMSAPTVSLYFPIAARVDQYVLDIRLQKGRHFE